MLHCYLTRFIDLGYDTGFAMCLPVSTHGQ